MPRMKNNRIRKINMALKVFRDEAYWQVGFRGCCDCCWVEIAIFRAKKIRPWREIADNMKRTICFGGQMFYQTNIWSWIRNWIFTIIHTRKLKYRKNCEFCHINKVFKRLKQNSIEGFLKTLKNISLAY